MIDEEIDKITRAAFPGGDTSYEEKYWKDMESVLGNSGRKRGFIFWWGAGAVALLISAVAVINLSNSPNEISDDLKTNAALTQVEPNDKEQVEKQETTPEQSEKIETNETNEKLKSVEKNTADYDSKKESIQTHNGQQTGITESATIQPVPTSGKKKLKESNQQLGKGTGASMKTLVAVSSTLDQSKETLPSTVKNENKTEQNASPEVKTVELAETVQKGEETSEVSEPEVTVYDKNDLEVVAEDNSEEKDQTMATEEPEEDSDLAESVDATAEKTEFGEKVKSGNKFKWFIQPSLSISTSQKGEVSLVETKSSSSHISPSAIREWNGGIEAGVRYGSFYLLSGLRFQEFNQSFSIRTVTTDIKDEYQYNQRDKIESIDRTLIRNIIVKVPDGNDFIFKVAGSEYSTDTNWTTVTDTVVNSKEIVSEEELSINYKLQYLSVPLRVGFEHVLGEKWLVETSIGANFGFLISQSGSVFNSNTNDVVVVGQSASIAKSTISSSFGVGVGYLLTPDLSLRLNPTYRYMIKGPNKDLINQSNFFGVGMQIRYVF
ncbi:MAG: hypothetical protein CL840_06875 [Crocinitomicaceae bacterium]|nr:hypothetical protein [Crocinitomicaceae bacterium]|tara:strand:+ start:2026 stop:3672 length:1647 start_codon:yes stop_codon:yes gene_type:complete